MRMSFYELMDILDKFCIDKAEEYDFRELTVHCNKIAGVECLFIKNNDEVIEVIVMNKK